MASILLFKEASFEACFALLQVDNFKTFSPTKHKTKTSSPHQKKKSPEDSILMCKIFEAVSKRPLVPSSCYLVSIRGGMENRGVYSARALAVFHCNGSPICGPALI